VSVRVSLLIGRRRTVYGLDMTDEMLDVVMNWLLLCTFRRAGFLLGLMIVAALSLGLAAPANAANPKEAITASFDPSTGVLTISGDDLNNIIAVSRDAAGAILVNGGAVPITGGPSTVANTRQIEVLGRGGNDQLSLDEANGALPRANMAGGVGNDTLTGGSGDDQLSGEADNDTLLGKAGNDILAGGDGNDVLDGGAGNDQAMGEAGNDKIVRNAGDDNDTLEGQDGSDKMLFNGASIAEKINISANGGRVLFTRDIATVTMDLNDVEAIDFTARGGADEIVINDLSGTDVTEINLNLAAVGGDAQPDTVILIGTNGDDVILPAGDASGTAVHGLAARVNITGAEAANDRLTINALAGDASLDASGLQAGAIQLTADGGDGNDVLIGGAGNDVLAGGDGDDVLLGGPGADTLDGGPGNNIVIQD
jgi:Ca2+-binding RTX toxin-like protein